MLDIQMTWEREIKREGKWISELSQGQREVWRHPVFSLAPQETPLVLVTSSSLPSLYCCVCCTNLSTCQFMYVFVSLSEWLLFYVSCWKEKMVKTLSASYPSLDSVSVCIAEADLSCSAPLARSQAQQERLCWKAAFKRGRQLLKF